MKLYEKIENDNFEEINEDRAIELIQSGNRHLVFNESYFDFKKQIEKLKKEIEELKSENVFLKTQELGYIAGYKDLEEENEEYKADNKYLDERVQFLEARRTDIIHKFQNEITDTTIPKSKVREKIEILEKHKQNIKPNTLDTAYKQAYCDGGIDSLNEIL